MYFHIFSHVFSYIQSSIFNKRQTNFIDNKRQQQITSNKTINRTHDLKTKVMNILVMNIQKDSLLPMLLKNVVIPTPNILLASIL